MTSPCVHSPSWPSLSRFERVLKAQSHEADKWQQKGRVGLAEVRGRYTRRGMGMA